MTTDNFIWNAGFYKIAFNITGLGIHPVQHGMIGIFCPVFYIFKNLFGDIFCFIALIRCTVNRNLFPGTVIGPQIFPLALKIVFDHKIGGIQNILRRAVILFQTNYFRIIKLLFKRKNIFDCCTPKLINALVIITDNAQIMMHLRQQAD